MEVLSSYGARGADPSATDANGKTILHLACINGDVEMTRALLIAGADVNAPDADGHTPIHVATIYSRPEILTLLVKHHPDLNARDVAGNMALHLAIRNRDAVCARHLIEVGASVTAGDANDRHPLDMFDNDAFPELAKLLDGNNVRQKIWKHKASQNQ